MFAGDLRHRIQRKVQANRQPGRPQGDPSGARGRSSLHRHQGGLSAQGPEAR